MKVLNVHERRLVAEPNAVGALIDSLASSDDRLWPRKAWPSMRFDRPLGIGAVGGHGPIRYTVVDYVPGVYVRFRFDAPRGFRGTHRYEWETVEGAVALAHVLEMETRGLATVTWPLFYRSLHDALIEDSLTVAQRSLGLAPERHPWSARVRGLRWIAGRGRVRSQGELFA